MRAAPDVSICIATYRRPAGLARLLESLAATKRPPGLVVETIVVDNDARGSAAAVARLHADPADLFHYVVEPRKNIAHARNRAVESARGRWLLFVDDDEFVEEDWLGAFLDFVECHQCDGAFGPVLPRLERVVSPWLDPETFYSRPRLPTGTPLGPGDVRTSNAIVARRLFGERAFDPAFGLTGGSDSALFGRMLADGAHFEWCDEARVVEVVSPERHRFRWLAQRAFRGGCVHGRIYGGAGAVGATRALVALLALVAAAPLCALAGRRVLARTLLRACTQAGKLWCALGRSYEEYAEG